MPRDIKVHTCKKQPSWTRSAVLAEAANDLTSIPVKRYSFHVKKTSPDRSKSHFGGQRTVPGSPSTILTDLESVLDGNPNETTVICSDIPPTSRDSEIFESEGNFNYDKTNFQKVRHIFPIDSPKDITGSPNDSEMAKTSVKQVNMVMQVVKEMQLKYQVVQKKSYPSTRWTRHQTYLSVYNMRASESCESTCEPCESTSEPCESA